MSDQPLFQDMDEKEAASGLRPTGDGPAATDDVIDTDRDADVDAGVNTVPAAGAGLLGQAGGGAGTGIVGGAPSAIGPAVASAAPSDDTADDRRGSTADDNLS